MAALPASSAPATTALSQLQSDEQRHVLDTIAQIRKCGLEGILSLPQLVVCGDQSAGKSSVLEALTEIPFPRNDNLCTRFATEITLRRAPNEALSIRIIPAQTRPSTERAKIEAFSETIRDFTELPVLMDRAMGIMGLDSVGSDGGLPRAFARDVLSIDIEGPTRPQLTLVDVPGLIQTETKGVTREDREMVAEITNFYIRQPRTICLAVICATNDYANQPILTKVREVDPTGERTLGIITKPDRLDRGSGMEAAFIELAQNKDVFFTLGWHVLRNRAFEEANFSVAEREVAEEMYFQESNFQCLSADCRGIASLRARLSRLLFDHVKQELPGVQRDLNHAMTKTSDQLKALGNDRVTPSDCRNFLTQLSLGCGEITKAAIDGHYEGVYFRGCGDVPFSPDSATALRRFRAMVQFLNQRFQQTMNEKGAKYVLCPLGPVYPEPETDTETEAVADVPEKDRIDMPIYWTKEQMLDWIGETLVRCRGKESVGNYNPLVIGELFWEQSSRWQALAKEHITVVADICQVFLHELLKEKCPMDVYTRLTTLKISKVLKERRERACGELQQIIDDSREHPAVYDHYYTDNVQKARNDRMKSSLTTLLGDATSEHPNPGCRSCHTSTRVDVQAAVSKYGVSFQRDAARHGCEEALDYLMSMYKFQKKTYIANVTTQVVERHLVRGLHNIFSPLYVNELGDQDILKMVGEPLAIRRQREFLTERLSKLQEGQEILEGAMVRG